MKPAIETYLRRYSRISDLRYFLSRKAGILCSEASLPTSNLATAEVKDTFRSPKFGLIAGSIVIEGTIKKNKFVRVIRDDVVIFEGLLDSLRRFKEDASEVPTGTECGIGIENYSEVRVGDKIEVFDKKEIRRTLDS